jgi:hypothetical protein
MCPMADMYEVRDRPQKVNLEKGAPENFPKEGSIGTTENVCRDDEYSFETNRTIKEIEPIPAKIAILHTEKESTILKVEEDPRKPWYFTRV